MNDIFEVKGTKFDFTIIPKENLCADLWFVEDFQVTVINGKIYLQNAKFKKENKGYLIKKKDFYTEIFNCFFEPSDAQISKLSISDIRVAVNTNPTSLRSLWLDLKNGWLSKEVA